MRHLISLSIILLFIAAPALAEKRDLVAIQKVEAESLPSDLSDLVTQGKAPKWIAGAAAFESMPAGDRRVLYGIGHAVGMTNMQLLRKAAEASARGAVAGKFNDYLTIVRKRYSAGPAADMSHLPGNVHDRTEKAFTQTVDIVEYWQHPTYTEAFALARMDVVRFLELSKPGDSESDALKWWKFVREQVAKTQ